MVSSAEFSTARGGTFAGKPLRHDHGSDGYREREGLREDDPSIHWQVAGRQQAGRSSKSLAK